MKGKRRGEARAWKGRRRKSETLALEGPVIVVRPRLWGSGLLRL